MAKNTQGKTVKRADAYEVWQGGSWTWYVRKKYQSPEAEAKNPYARWFCDVVTPMSPSGDTGDVYIREIKSAATRVK